MKKFDLEKAKNGAAVCMRDGTPVKILDFDYAGAICYKYKAGDGEPKIAFVGQDGVHRPNPDNNGIRKFDLFMAPTIAYTTIYINRNTSKLYGGELSPTYEEAKNQPDNTVSEWERFCIGKIELLQDGEED